jgi:hypothetical protein
MVYRGKKGPAGGQSKEAKMKAATAKKGKKKVRGILGDFFLSSIFFQFAVPESSYETFKKSPVQLLPVNSGAVPAAHS